MKKISCKEISIAVEKLCDTAACDLPKDVFETLTKAKELESSELGKSFFNQYIENANIAKSERMPLCQDTGFAVIFVELGTKVELDGDIYKAINEGVASGYEKSFLRKSIVNDPLFLRQNTKNNTPAIIHLKLVDSESIKIILAPKGGGSENMSALKMLKPSDGVEGVIDFAVNTIKLAGGNPCPPTIMGIGIGGTMEYAAYMAKCALLREVGSENENEQYAKLEKEILTKVNNTGVGPQGLGGDISCLAVHIQYHPCHIASLPVAINLNCHAARHAEVIL